MGKIAFQGEPGSFSDEASRRYTSGLEALPCPTFAHVFRAVTGGEADAAMVPVENAIAGRVDDVYRLLPDMDLAIVAEHFLPVSMSLLIVPGTSVDDVKVVRSHAMALGQCGGFLERRGLLPEAARDTAGAARQLSESREPGVAAIASEAAADRYGLEIAEKDIQDADKNVTRFLHLVREGSEEWPDLIGGPVITSLVFRVRNIPAALYKAMGGFATNTVNMIKIESYQEDATFTATRFQAEIEGHPDDPPVRRALDELGYFCSDLRLLGVFPADPYRASQNFRS